MREYRKCLLAALVLFPLGCGSEHTENAPRAQVESAETEEPPSAPASTATSLDIAVAQSSLGFTGAKVTGSHDGSFGEWSGTIALDDASAVTGAQITIQTASLNADHPRLTRHLRSDDFFDVERFPTAEFRSLSLTPASGEGGTTHRIRGNLTLHGQTRAITFPARIQVSDAEVRAQARFTINRQEFGLTYPGMPDDLIRDEVVVHFDVVAPRSGA